MFCHQCGKKLPEQAKFCNGCGQSQVSDNGEVQTPVSAPAPTAQARSVETRLV
ncbi:MAG TPA: zinc ribbon domain-containing protein, partial [Candidatus Wirthbacteria bacterium]|nr:zinc ribbon domain-containing protein [Candidatus Wirthbacteria bacterium]